jgi:hypothetical protein
MSDRDRRNFLKKSRGILGVSLAGMVGGAMRPVRERSDSMCGTKISA